MTDDDISGPLPGGPRLTIGEVAERAGRRRSSIRYYESIGLLPEPERVSGQRRYGPEVLRTLAVIDAAQRAGLSLEEVRDVLMAGSTGTPVGDRLRALAERKLPEVEAVIDHAEAVRRWLHAAGTCQCLTLEECPLLDADAPPACAR